MWDRNFDNIFQKNFLNFSKSIIRLKIEEKISIKRSKNSRFLGYFFFLLFPLLIFQNNLFLYFGFFMFYKIRRKTEKMTHVDLGGNKQRYQTVATKT